ncbi:MAG: amidohydrolase family protein [Chloroflexota bacterium]
MPSSAALPLVNAHTHMRSALNSLLNLADIMEGCGLEALVVACTSATRPERLPTNALALLMKAMYRDRVYWFPGLHYAMPAAGYAAPPVVEQMAQAIALGADGIKLIEGKPTARRELGLPLDGAHYEPIYAACEAHGLPILMHVADPEELWDWDALPEWARQRKWFYGDGTFPTKEGLYAEVERILERHPRLKLILAHFYFLSGDMARAAAFLDRWPSACFDITPGGEMYERFSAAPAAWRDFFTAYCERLLFGTDTSGGGERPDPEGLARAQRQVADIRRFLETDDTFDGLGRRMLHGLALPPETLASIYAGNIRRLAGAAPRPLALPAALEALDGERAQMNGADALREPGVVMGVVRERLARLEQGWAR